MDDTSRYEILFDLKRGEYRPAEVGGIRTRTVRAGDTIEVECYPLTRIGPAARAEAVTVSSRLSVPSSTASATSSMVITFVTEAGDRCS